MSQVIWLLSLTTMLLFYVCWPWGIASVFKATKHHQKITKFLWRVVSIFIPIGGFLLVVH